MSSKLTITSANDRDISNAWVVDGSSTRMYHSGNMGIGLTNPSSKLDVSGLMNVTGDLYYGSLTASFPRWTASSTVLSTTSNVGIGNTVVTNALDISGTLPVSSNIAVGNSLTTTRTLIDVSGNIRSGKSTVTTKSEISVYSENIPITINDVSYNVSSRGGGILTMEGGLNVKNSILLGTSNGNYSLDVSGNIYMKKYLVGMNGRFSTVQPDLVSIYRLPESSNSGISPYFATYFAYINNSKEVVINSIHNSYTTAFEAIGNTGVFTEQVYSLPVGEFASKLYTTGSSIAVITEAGNVYMMGYNGNAMCGIRVNNTVVTTDPINNLIRGFTSDASGNLAITDPFSKIIFGSDIDGFATFALTTTGKLYATGSNDFGQLANGTTTNSNNASINGPRRVTFSGIGQNRTVSDAICVGGRATTIPTTLVVLDTSGIVWAAGYGGQGQIGQSTTADVNNLLRRVKSSATTDLSNGVVAIYGSGGDNSTTIFAVHTSGDLYVWGNNNSNTKYDGTTGNIVVAKKINSFFNNESVTKVWTGFYFSTNTFVRTSTGKIYGTGSGQALGINSTTSTSGWQELKFFNTTTRILDNFYIGHVDNGADITFARTYDTNGIYSLWVTGKNNQGSAGIGMTSDVRTWIEVSLPPEIVRRIATIVSSNWGSRFGIDTGTTIIHLDDGTALIAGKHLPLSNNNTVFSKFVPLCRYITSEEPN